MLKIAYLLLLIGILSNTLFYKNVYFSDNSHQVYFNDIGQGDSILIRSSDDKRVLIDSGIDITLLQELAETLPFYDKHIDIIAMSHLDADHIAGFVEVLEQYQVEQVWLNGSNKNNLLLMHLKELLKYEQVQIYEFKQEDKVEVGCCLDFEVIWPPETISESIEENDLSLAFILRSGEHSLYFAGDLSSEFEVKALQQFTGEIDVMKVSHHGSKTSTSLEVLELLKPKLAVISAGRDNKFGHPHQEILDNLEIVNAQVYRTDIHGRIQISLQESTIRISTEKK